MRRNSECGEPEDFLVFRYTNLKRTKHISDIKYVLSFDLFIFF